MLDLAPAPPLKDCAGPIAGISGNSFIIVLLLLILVVSYAYSSSDSSLLSGQNYLPSAS